MPSSTPVTATSPSTLVRSRLTASGPQDYGIILGQAEFFSRHLADQRKPIGSYVSQQRPEQFHRGTYLHSHPQRDRLSLFRKADESDVPSPLDGGRQFALVPHTIAGDTPRDNPTPLS